VVVSLARHWSLESAGHDSLISVENVIGSRFADTLIGDAGDDVLVGGRVTTSCGAAAGTTGSSSEGRPGRRRMRSRVARPPGGK